jgi:hypothetical protein
MIAGDPWLGPETLTLVFPLGVFLVGIVWLFFERRPNR